jgi:hypothetical protein
MKLGGRILHIGEMRLSDLADLQVWLDECWECPLDSLRDTLDDLQGWERRKALRGIWDATEQGPAVWGDARARKLMNTGRGIIQQFRGMLNQYHPELCRADEDGRYLDLEAIAEGVSNGPEPQKTFLKMVGAWQPGEAIEELAYLLDEVPESGGGKVTWVQAVMEVCEVYHWTIDYTMGLTMRQFRAARTGGKAEDTFGTAVAPKTNLKAIVAAKKAQLAEEEKAVSGGR